MTTEELAELFLASLYDLAEAAPHPNFLFTMNDFVARLGISDMTQLRKALNHLENKGLIFLATTDAWGGVSAGITIEGSIFVENGGETGIIERYRNDPASVGLSERPRELILPEQPFPEPAFVPDPAAPAAGEDESGKMIDSILAEMATVIRVELAVDPATRKDLISDVETLQIQLSRQTKNDAVIRALLENLSKFPAIAPLVRLIVRFAGAQ